MNLNLKSERNGRKREFQMKLKNPGQTEQAKDTLSRSPPNFLSVLLFHTVLCTLFLPEALALERKMETQRGKAI